MKGLLLNGFYSAVGNIKLFLFVVFLAGAVLIATGSPTAQELFVYIAITALSINGVSGMRKESASQWSKYEITMPVRRKDIIKCKYFNYLFWVLAGTLLAVLVTIIAIFLHREMASLEFSSMFVLGIGISLMTGACFYPLAYLVGTDKSETVLVISLLGAIAVAIAVISYLNRIDILSYVWRMVIFAGFCCALFGFSYLVTVRAYLKKEF